MAVPAEGRGRIQNSRFRSRILEPDRADLGDKSLDPKKEPPRPEFGRNL
jgi:hypothetical protein